MLTEGHVVVLDPGDSTVLECSFKSLRFNMFDYPMIWRKQQLNEWTQINVMGSVNEPFVSRFELSFTATPPYYLIQLSILGLFLSTGWPIKTVHHCALLCTVFILCFYFLPRDACNTC